MALRWRTAPLTLLEAVPYNRAGWGICAVGDWIVTSDGNSELVRRDRRLAGNPLNTDFNGTQPAQTRIERVAGAAALTG